MPIISTPIKVKIKDGNCFYLCLDNNALAFMKGTNITPLIFDKVASAGQTAFELKDRASSNFLAASGSTVKLDGASSSWEHTVDTHWLHISGSSSQALHHDAGTGDSRPAKLGTTGLSLTLEVTP